MLTPLGFRVLSVALHQEHPKYKPDGCLLTQPFILALILITKGLQVAAAAHAAFLW